MKITPFPGSTGNSALFQPPWNAESVQPASLWLNNSNSAPASAGRMERTGRPQISPTLHRTAENLCCSLSGNPEESCLRGNGPMAIRHRVPALAGCRRKEGAYPQGSVTDEQRSQRAASAKTLRAAGLLQVACVGSAVAARCGDAPASPQDPHSFRSGFQNIRS